MTRPFDEIMHHKDGDCSITTDARYYPIVFCHIEGPFTEESVRFYFLTWRKPMTDYAESRGEKIVTIVALSSLAPPPATVRRAAGEHVATDNSTVGLLGTVIVVSNPVLRGVITAMVWIAGSDNTHVEYVNSLETGIINAAKSLGRLGISTNIEPAAYKAPV